MKKNWQSNSSSPRAERLARRAFTLIEVLIVLVIVLAIGGIVAVNLLPKREEALKQTQQVQLDNIDQALKLFMLDMRRYPTEDEGIAALWDETVLDNEEDEANWKGPYLESTNLEDEWGNEYQYRYPAEADETKYELWSNGPDGEEDNEDDIKARSYPGGDDEDGMGDFSDFDRGGGG